MKISKFTKFANVKKGFAKMLQIYKHMRSSLLKLTDTKLIHKNDLQSLIQNVAKAEIFKQREIKCFTQLQLGIDTHNILQKYFQAKKVKSLGKIKKIRRYDVFSHCMAFVNVLANKVNEISPRQVDLQNITPSLMQWKLFSSELTQVKQGLQKWSKCHVQSQDMDSSNLYSISYNFSYSLSKAETPSTAYAVEMSSRSKCKENQAKLAQFYTKRCQTALNTKSTTTVQSTQMQSVSHTRSPSQNRLMKNGKQNNCSASFELDCNKVLHIAQDQKVLPLDNQNEDEKSFQQPQNNQVNYSDDISDDKGINTYELQPLKEQPLSLENQQQDYEKKNEQKFLQLAIIRKTPTISKQRRSSIRKINKNQLIQIQHQRSLRKKTSFNVSEYRESRISSNIKEQRQKSKIKFLESFKYRQQDSSHFQQLEKNNLQSAFNSSDPQLYRKIFKRRGKAKTPIENEDNDENKEPAKLTRHSRTNANAKKSIFLQSKKSKIYKQCIQGVEQDIVKETLSNTPNSDPSKKQTGQRRTAFQQPASQQLLVVEDDTKRNSCQKQSRWLRHRKGSRGMAELTVDCQYQQDQRQKWFRLYQQQTAKSIKPVKAAKKKSAAQIQEDEQEEEQTGNKNYQKFKGFYKYLNKFRQQHFQQSAASLLSCESTFFLRQDMIREDRAKRLQQHISKVTGQDNSLGQIIEIPMTKQNNKKQNYLCLERKYAFQSDEDWIKSNYKAFQNRLEQSPCELRQMGNQEMGCRAQAKPLSSFSRSDFIFDVDPQLTDQYI